MIFDSFRNLSVPPASKEQGAGCTIGDPGARSCVLFEIPMAVMVELPRSSEDCATAGLGY